MDCFLTGIKAMLLALQEGFLSGQLTRILGLKRFFASSDKGMQETVRQLTVFYDICDATRRFLGSGSNHWLLLPSDAPNQAHVPSSQIPRVAAFGVRGVVQAVLGRPPAASRRPPRRRRRRGRIAEWRRSSRGIAAEPAGHRRAALRDPGEPPPGPSQSAICGAPGRLRCAPLARCPPLAARRRHAAKSCAEPAVGSASTGPPAAPAHRRVLRRQFLEMSWSFHLLPALRRRSVHSRAGEGPSPGSQVEDGGAAGHNAPV